MFVYWNKQVYNEVKVITIKKKLNITNEILKIDHY